MHRARQLVGQLSAGSERPFIRQAVLLSADLERALDTLCSELDLQRASFRDPGLAVLGLHNVVLPVGQGMFLEVVSPLDLRSDNTANRQLGRRKGDGGYMLMFQTSNLKLERARLEKEVPFFEREGMVAIGLCGGA